MEQISDFLLFAFIVINYCYFIIRVKPQREHSISIEISASGH